LPANCAKKLIRNTITHKFFSLFSAENPLIIIWKNLFKQALSNILGKEASGLTSSTISRLKNEWESDYETWQTRDLSHKRYVYIWADGVHFHVRSNDARACMLVMIGVTDMGRKELVAVELGYKENAENWRGMIHGLKAQGLVHPPWTCDCGWGIRLMEGRFARMVFL
jgi:hypothetical protein